MKKFIFALILTSLAMGSSVLPSHAMTIRINAPKIILDLAPGETYTGQVDVENPTSDDVLIKAYLEDWVYKPGGTGEKDFLPAGSHALSASKWINFSPAETPVKAFGRATVRYTVTVPQDVRGGYYSVLFFETLLGQATTEEGAVVNVTGRVGALFFIDIKGTVQRDGKVESVELKAPAGNKPMEIFTAFHNLGNADITLGGNYLIMGEEGSIKARGQMNKIYTFPGALETGKTEWVGRLDKGSYQALLTYDLGKGKSLVEERDFTVE